MNDLLTTWGVDELEVTPTHDLVHFARRGEEHVVVKVGDPLARHREALALMSYQGDAHARLLEHDRDSGTLLIERVLPGDDQAPLARLDDDSATARIAELLLALHARQEAQPGLPALSDIGQAFAGPRDSRIPIDLRDRAQAQFVELVAGEGHVVLHGDLHHLNVLNAGEGRVRAIDPHGWWGDPVFDTAAMLANPRGLVEGGDARGMDGRELARRWDRRVHILADITGFDVDRIQSWSFVACIIAELWMVESHDMVHGAPLALAEHMTSRSHDLSITWHLRE